MGPTGYQGYAPPPVKGPWGQLLMALNYSSLKSWPLGCLPGLWPGVAPLDMASAIRADELIRVGKQGYTLAVYLLKVSSENTEY